MCLQYYWILERYEEGRYVRCGKCDYPFEMGWGGKSKGTSCRNHHINKEGFCDHCEANITDVESLNCYHVAKKTWWERLTGGL